MRVPQIRPLESAAPIRQDRVVASEASRHALYAELEQLLGTEHADTLMTSLPMEQADHLATKTDIRGLEDRFDRFENRFEQKFDAFSAEIRGEVREMHALMHDPIPQLHDHDGRRDDRPHCNLRGDRRRSRLSHAYGS